MTPASGRTAHYKNDLQRLTIFIGAALVVFGALLLGIVAYAGWSANRAAVARERQLVENALDQSVSHILDEQKAICWWDDAVAQVQRSRLDVAWLETNFGIYFHETYGHDEVIILDSDNRPIYANVGGERTNPRGAYARHQQVFDELVTEARSGADGHLRNRASTFSESQGNYSSLLGASFGRWAGHIMNVNGVPAVVGIMSIVPNLDPHLLHGDPHMLVSVVKIDNAFLADVGRSLLISDLAVSTQPSTAAGVISEPFLADDGTPLGYLSWTPKQPGNTLLMFILPMVGLGVLGAGILTWMMILRLQRASEELASREELSRYQALHDALSGLPNRHHFVGRLQETLDALLQSRNNGRVVVAYIDVDRFKDINDTMGHQAGDALIMAVAARLRGAIGPQDFLSRFGDDEFAVLRCAGDSASADDLAKRLHDAFEETFDVYGQNIRMTASVGLAMAPKHGFSPAELMRHADIALYQAKNRGRDRAMFFSAEMAAEVEQRRAIELDLQAAISAQTLTMYYQPLVSCGSGRVVSLEALLRWRHPVKGDISPAIFVPIAEEAGLMPALGAFVLEQAFKDAHRWPGLDIAINLSPVQFRHVDLVSLLRRLIERHAMDPSRIVLEVTEGVMMESTERNRQQLDAIRDMGFKVALDDFGTGYSSLRYLCDFHFDKIKIDRAFVTGVHQRKAAMTVIQSVVTLGRGLGMGIVAEGVETEAEASVMRLVGVTELQGFFFSKAVPADEVEGVVASIGAPAAAAEQPIISAGLRRPG